MAKPKILAFAGSSRKGSVNKKIAHLAAQIAEEQGAEVELIELNDFPMPIYNADEEETAGLPEHAIRLKEKMRNADGFLIASPEYNGSFTPLFKNTIDWASRPHGDEPSLICFQNKVVCLLSASPGRLGGLRSLNQCRTLLSGIGAIVMPKEFALPGAYQAFTEEGLLSEEAQTNQLKKTVEQYVLALKKLKATP